MNKQIVAIIREAAADFAADADCVRLAMIAVACGCGSVAGASYAWVVSLGLAALHRALPVEPWWIGWLDIPVVITAVLGGVTCVAAFAGFACACMEIVWRLQTRHENRRGASRYEW